MPITSGGACAPCIGFAVPIDGIEASGAVRFDQPRVRELNARGTKKFDTPSQPILDEVLAKTATPVE